MPRYQFIIRAALLAAAVVALALAGEFGRLALAACSAIVVWLAFGLGHRAGAEERERALKFLQQP